jgi:EmrB/QacA subfamily drug resistance transporter
LRRQKVIGAASDEFCRPPRSESSNDDSEEEPMTLDNRTRWLALIVLCLGDLMIVLDTTIVNVALPSIREDLGFSETSLAWVVNAYLLTFGGFLLLGGRLGDLFGHRRLFLTGITLFTMASLACGLAGSQAFLIGARAVQGLGGAVVSAVAFSLIMTLFTEQSERAKAMGVFGFVMAGGGSLGVLLGGVLTDAIDWHWIFLVNVPIGIAVFASTLVLLPGGRGQAQTGRLDVAGAVTVTTALMVAVYAIVNGNETGWATTQTLGLLAVAAILFASFLVIETRSSAPLVPLRLFKRRNIATSNVLGILWSAAMFAWFFLSALYLQLVLGFSPLEVGLAFLPANLIMGAFSLGLSAKLVMRFGVRVPIATGMLLVATGLALFARAPVDGSFVADVLPGMIVLGIGVGMAMNPVLLAAMSDVEPHESGLASGVVNTSFMMGGALGLAVLASLADARTQTLSDAGEDALTALNGGYQLAFLVGAIFAVGAAMLGAFVLRTREAAAPAAHDEPVGQLAVEPD